MKKKLLDCPVADKTIKPSICGANRISRYNCPESCPHNPWSLENYSKSLEIYDRFRDKLYTRMRAEGIPRPPSFSDEKDLYKTVVWVRDKLYTKKDSNGLTFKQRWKNDKYAGLNNDQKTYINAEADMRPALLEIHQIRDDHTIIAVDLLRPEEGSFLIADYAMAATVCRFSVIFCLTFDMHHYRCINVTAADFSFIPHLPPADAFNELTRHLGAPQDHEQMLQWLSDHVADVFKSIYEIADARKTAAQNNLQAFKVNTIYTINCPVDELLDTIDDHDEMVQEELSKEKTNAGFIETWTVLEDDFESKVQQKVIGTILLHEDNYIQLETLTQTDEISLKPKIEKLFGSKIKFKMENKEDISAVYKSTASSSNSDLVPPALLENLPSLEISSHRIDYSKLPPSSKPIEVQIIEQQINDFLDKKIPSLNNKTPREAAKIPQLRPQLIRLMKMHTRNWDKHNLEKGLNIDFNHALTELGLDEINFPPPPVRNTKANEDFHDDDYYDDDFLPPMSPEDIEGLINIIDKTYSHEERIEQLKKRFPDFCNAIKVICKKTENMQLVSTIYDTASYAVFLIINPSSNIGEDIYNPNLLYDNFDIAVQIFTKDTNKEEEEPPLAQPYIAQMIINRITNDIPENNKELGNLISHACILTIAMVETLEKTIYQLMEHP